METARTFTAITCVRALRRFGSAPRPYGYTLAIAPPVQPEPDTPPDRPPQPTDKHCDTCGQLPPGRLYDITSCGDWLTVCGPCRERIQPPKPRYWQGWYKFKADAVERAAQYSGGAS